jgi:hypothetical protein
MSEATESGFSEARQRLLKARVPLIMALDSLLSVTFLVLATYIWYYAPGVSGKNGHDLFWFSILLGAYGLWRAIRSVIRYRQKRMEEGE